MSEQEYTSISVPEATKERLEEAKPFPSISWEDFMNHLLDVYESDGTHNCVENISK